MCEGIRGDPVTQYTYILTPLMILSVYILMISCASGAWLGLMNVNTFSLNYFHLQDPSTVHKQTELPLHEPASQ